MCFVLFTILEFAPCCLCSVSRCLLCCGCCDMLRLTACESSWVFLFALCKSFVFVVRVCAIALLNMWSKNKRIRPALPGPARPRPRPGPTRAGPEIEMASDLTNPKIVEKHIIWCEMASENSIRGMDTWIWLQISIRMHWR